MALPERRGTSAPARVTDADEAGAIAPSPRALAAGQRDEAARWLALAASGAGLRWAWPTLADLLGPVLPGWLVVIGARPQAGKTTLVLSQALAWADEGHRGAIIGTETDPAVLRITLAALALGLNVGRAVAGELAAEDAAALARNLDWQAEVGAEALMVADQRAGRTLADVLYWMRWAAARGASFVIFDHLQEMQLAGTRSRFQELEEAVRTLRAEAVRLNVVLLLCAQFNRGQGSDPLLLHEVPTETLWRDTDALQQAAVIALQLWRPLRPGITNEIKRAFREQRPPEGKLYIPTIDDIVQPDTMAIKIAKHRYRNRAKDQIRRLSIVDDVITDLETPA